MRELRFLLVKEFRQIFRDPAILRLIFVIPVIQLIILPFAADYEMKNINVAIVDQDHSSFSRYLATTIYQSTYFRLVDYTHSYEESLSWIENEKTDLVVQIPPNFERDLVRHDQAKLFIAANAINGTKANLGTSYVSQIIKEINQDIREHWIQFPRLSPFAQIEVTSRHWFNKDMNYQVFMVPGILAILLTMVGSFLAALNIVREKEIGTIEQINVTPISKPVFILGKLIPFWFLGLCILTLGLLVSYVVYGIVPRGNIGLLYVYSAIYLLAISGIGLFISTISYTQQQAMFISFFFLMIFILLGGIYTPVESMPRWAQVITWFNPVVYMGEIMRMLILKGSEFHHIKTHLIIIAIFAVVLNGAAIWNYRKTV